jgi:hypothetical protein
VHQRQRIAPTANRAARYILEHDHDVLWVKAVCSQRFNGIGHDLLLDFHATTNPE